MAKIYIILSIISTFASISPLPFLASAQTQDKFDLNGVWERYDKAQINIEQTGSQVIATSDYYCPEGGSNDSNLEFAGTIDGNQISGDQSAWCYSGSSNPNENGLFFDPFRAIISDDGNQLTLFSNDRFAGVEQSVSYSKISGPTGVESSPTEDQSASTTDQLRDTLTSTLSQAKEPLTSLQENALPMPLLLAGLGVAVIGGGTAAYIKHRSSKKSQQKEEQANIEVVIRGGID